MSCCQETCSKVKDCCVKTEELIAKNIDTILVDMSIISNVLIAHNIGNEVINSILQTLVKNVKNT